MTFKKILPYLLIIIILIITIFSAIFLIFTPTDNPFTDKKIDSAINEAIVSNKTVILLFYADWCPVCHKFFNTTLSNNSIEEALNKNYIVVYVETSQNPGIRDKYGVKKRPTLIFLNKNRKEEEKRIEGYVDSQKLLSIIK